MKAPTKENSLRKQIIKIGRRLSDLHMARATAGNLSVRLDNRSILITKTAQALGELSFSDIIKVSLIRRAPNKMVSSEYSLHRLIYKNFSANAVIHCHPPLINAYFSVYSKLKLLTFESKIYLDNLPLVKLKTPTVTRPEIVISALRENNLVVIRHHGVVAIAGDFKEALYLIERLEEAVRIAAVARLLKKAAPDDLDKALKKYPKF